MQLNPYCTCCQLSRQEERIRDFKDETRKMEYMKLICRRLSEAGPDDCAPSLSVEFKKLFSAFWDVPPVDYSGEKHRFNQLMLSMEDTLMAEIRQASDPLREALRIARLGNYIDFSVIPDANPETLLSLLDAKKEDDEIDEGEYRLFLSETAAAKKLLYIPDNCGEIVLDKLVIRLLKELYPGLSITMLVRGMPVSNDVTMEDAVECGLTELLPVCGNGSDIGGTHLPKINEESRSLLTGSDIILAKGQGNFETLNGCGLNIYYLFLCKCELFCRRFHAGHLQGMFVNEKRIR